MENATQTPTQQVQATQPTQPVQAQPAASTQQAANSQAVTPTTQTEPSKGQKAKNFLNKMRLIKKKHDYINGKGMDPIAAETQARKDLNLPEMTEDEKAKAGKKNIFEKVLEMTGLDKKLSKKPEQPATPNQSEQK